MTVRRVTVRTGRRVPAILLVVLALAIACSLLAGGCGRSPQKTVLATVGPRSITQAYYEEKLGNLKETDLPRDPQGRSVDTATAAGRRAFLDVIINKDLMALKAEELGLGADQRIGGALDRMRERDAAVLLHYDLIEKPAQPVTEAQIQEYYQNLQTKRKCSYILCNFRDDCEKARLEVVAGKPWTQVAEQYNDSGTRGPADDFTLDLAWGRLEDNFEHAIWSLKQGEISQPIATVYGYWLIRVDAIGPVKVPPLDDTYKQRVIATIRARRINVARRAFLDESARKHDYKLDDNALWIAFQGLPEKEELLDPATNQPTAQEKLQPLQILPQDMDKFLYQVRLGDKLESYTLGDYKAFFDKSNVFDRPKRAEMLGGMREKIRNEVDVSLELQEAVERGYMKDPRVEADLVEKRERMMITRLHEQVVKIDETISPAELEAFYTEHAAEFAAAEIRFGKVLVCATEQAATQARAEAAAGKSWDELLARFSSDSNNKQTRGNLGPVAADAMSPLRAPLFALALHELGPVQKIESSWVVIRCDSTATRPRATISEAGENIGMRIRAQRKEQKLQDLLVEWRQQFPVKIFDNRLAKVRSWAQLTAQPRPENPLTKPQQR